MNYLSDRFAGFLRHGGKLSVIVGIDLENTTHEGLQALLDLEQFGTCETFVYHNESDSVFHPKLYLWRNEEEARLIVGSNNITQSGLYINVEAGLQLDLPVDDPVVIQTVDALSSWKSENGNLAKRLDATFLAQLVSGGYVPSESAVRASIARRRTAQSGSRLFGARRFVPPAPPAQAQPAASPSPSSTVASTGGVAAAGTVLLMRLRKASVTDRPTQTQIPFRVGDTFFRGATAVRSAHDGGSHGIISATARGNRNTIKLEIPEMRNFVEPLARFERTPNGIVYEVYDVGSPQVVKFCNRSKLVNKTVRHSCRSATHKGPLGGVLSKSARFDILSSRGCLS
jgi:hypothetical protein